MSTISMAVLNWSAWAPGITTRADWQAWARGELTLQALGTPPVTSVEPMVRRRLSSLSRLMLEVADDCMQGQHAAASVWASRHGELEVTTKLLEQQAAGEALSPMGFGLSVANTAAGLYAIVKCLQAPSTTISASFATLSAAYIEAYGQLCSGRSDVLLVYAEQPAPACYELDEQVNGPALSVAMHLAVEGEQRLWHQPSTPALVEYSNGEALIRSLLGRGATEHWHYCL